MSAAVIRVDGTGTRLRLTYRACTLFTENSASLAWHTSHASPSWVVLASACEAELLSLWHAEQAAVSGGELVM